MAQLWHNHWVRHCITPSYANTLQSTTIVKKIHEGTVTLDSLLTRKVNLHARGNALWLATATTLFKFRNSSSSRDITPRQFRDEKMLLKACERTNSSELRDIKRLRENNKVAFLTPNERTPIFTAKFHGVLKRHVYVTAHRAFLTYPIFGKYQGLVMPRPLSPG